MRRLRRWAWARVHWPLLAVAWGVSFHELAERFGDTFGLWGGRACAFLVDYAIWLGWEAVNRVSRTAGKVYAAVFMAVAVLVSFAFQVDPTDAATFVPPGLLAGGVIAAYLLRPGREDVTDDGPAEAEARADAGRPVSVGIPLPAGPEPTALSAAEPTADVGREDVDAADHLVVVDVRGEREAVAADDPAHRAMDRPGRADLGRVDHREPARPAAPRGRAVATPADHDAVYAMVRDGEVPEGPMNLKRTAVVERTAAADRAAGGAGVGVTTRLAVELLREARERVAAGNGTGDQPATDASEVMADA